MKKIKVLIAFLLVCLITAMLFTACKKEVTNENETGIRSRNPTGSPLEDEELIELNRDNEDKNEIKLPDNDFTLLMPKMEVKLKTVADNKFGTTAIYEAISKSDFEALVMKVKEIGFNMDVKASGLEFSAANADGMLIKILSAKQEIKISVYNDNKHFG
ncbi:MAG: hypothetical protein GX802_08660 [Clostridiales bacterium]|nr:hypothetical protein [Clostridiales bacterium]